MKQAVTSLLFFLYLFPVATGANDMTLEIIPLKHRLVEDVVPVLRPLLAPGGTITGMNNQVIIKSTPGNIAELKSVLDGIDKTLRKLMITVEQDTGTQINRSDRSASGRYESDNISIGHRDKKIIRDGLVVSGEDGAGNNIRFRARDRETLQDDSHAYRVQTVEGSPAFIQSGQSVPLRQRQHYVTPDGVVVTDSVEYYDAGSGFYVLPRLNGNRVTLLAAPRLTKVAPGKRPVFNVQDVQTTASGMLGEWIRLGGINQDFNSSSKELLSSTSEQVSQTGSVWIKVDEIE